MLDCMHNALFIDFENEATDLTFLVNLAKSGALIEYGINPGDHLSLERGSCIIVEESHDDNISGDENMDEEIGTIGDVYNEELVEEIVETFDENSYGLPIQNVCNEEMVQDIVEIFDENSFANHTDNSALEAHESAIESDSDDDGLYYFHMSTYVCYI